MKVSNNRQSIGGAANQIDDFIAGGKQKDSCNPAVRNIVLELNMEGLDVESDKVKGNKGRITFTRVLDSVEKSTAKEILESAGVKDVHISDGKCTTAEFTS